MGKKDRLKFGLDSLFEDNNNDAPEQEAVTEAADNTAGSVSAPAAAEVQAIQAAVPAAEVSDSRAEGLRSVRISLIEPDKKQPRKEFDEEKLSELAENIMEMGVLQPLLVRPAEAPGRYTIVAGERRWRAARQAGLTEVPVIVKEMTDVEAAQVALIENIQREDLNPVEEARAYKRLAEEFYMTQEQIARSLGKPRSVIANAIRLLDMPEVCIEALRDKIISVGHAKVICGMRTERQQIDLLNETVFKGYSVRQIEARAREMLEGLSASYVPEKPKKKLTNDREEIKFIEYSLSIKNEYGVEPEFKKKANGSVVMNIKFNSEEELDEFFKKL